MAVSGRMNTRNFRPARLTPHCHSNPTCGDSYFPLSVVRVVIYYVPTVPLLGKVLPIIGAPRPVPHNLDSVLAF